MTTLRHAFVLATAGCLVQSATGQGLDTAARDAQRYLGCIDSLDVACVEELTYPGFPACDVITQLYSLARLRDLIENVEDLGELERGYWRAETAEPAAMESEDSRLFAFVPFRVTYRIDQWASRPGFLLGVSENDGESWRFIEDGIVRAAGVNQIVPGYTGVPPLTIPIADRPADPLPARSDYLETLEAGFVLGTDDGDATVRLDFELRKRVRNPLTVVTAFQNPRSEAEPIVVSAALMPGDDSFTVSSPQIAGLLAGQYYEAVVSGLDPETNEVVFEHRQMLRFFPVGDYHDQVIPAVAGPPVRNMSFNALVASGYANSAGNSRQAPFGAPMLPRASPFPQEPPTSTARLSRGPPDPASAIPNSAVVNRPTIGTAPPEGCAQ